MKKLALIAISLFAVANMQAGKHKHCNGNPQAAAKALLAKQAASSTNCKDKVKALHDLRKVCEKHPELATLELAATKVEGSCKHAKEQREELAKIAKIAIKKA